MKKHIPNVITCCNLMSGCIAVSFAHAGRIDMALLLIVVGAVFDFFDGLSARLLGVSSPIGKELDSLADVVTFGVAPAAMLSYELSVLNYPQFMEGTRVWLPYVAYVMAAFSALRLAKFNLDERQTTSFIGLPTPANALFWGSLLLGGRGLIESASCGHGGIPSAAVLVVLLILEAAACRVMTSELPMFALKFKHYAWRGNEARYIFLVVCLPLIAVFRLASLAVIIVWYIALSLFLNSRKTKNAD